MSRIINTIMQLYIKVVKLTSSGPFSPACCSEVSSPAFPSIFAVVLYKHNEFKRYIIVP